MPSKSDPIEDPHMAGEPVSPSELALDLLDIDGNALMTYPPEVIDNLRGLTLRLSIEDRFPGKIALTSALRGEGVTYLTHALALTLANDTEANVGLVDLNWWWPSTHAFIPDDSCGLGCLFDDNTKSEVIIPSGLPNLSIIPAGNLDVRNRSKAARSAKLKEIIAALSKRFDHLIMDIPAIQSTRDAVPLLSLADGCCFVIRQGATQLEDVRLALDSISHLHLYGVILNQVKFSTPDFIRKLIPQT